MKTKGLRISDIEEGKCIPLSRLLTHLPNNDQLRWSILWLDLTPITKEGKSIIELQKKINNSKDGLSCSFEFLIEMSRKNFQEINLTIIASNNKENLHRYKDDQKMYENCDIVIEIIDGGFSEIFSTDINWINQLEKKFKDVQFLKANFQNNL